MLVTAFHPPPHGPGPNWVRVDIPKGQRDATFSLMVDSEREEKITIEAEGYHEEFMGKGQHNIAHFKRPRTKNLTYKVTFNEAIYAEIVKNTGMSSVYHHYHIIAYDKNSNNVNATVYISWIKLPDEPPEFPYISSP
eukprot:Phypoly_transcript_23810.p1 GENE.Phypoly_transcript_23810~~Phypoly_transcript_23810.p1  ORF type:complete len:137 (+),score=21.32 Phypoly_transcript_23810:20-430(+)